MRTLRRSIQGLKSKQYQIVAVTGVISDHEYDVSIAVWISDIIYLGQDNKIVWGKIVNISLYIR